MRQAKEQKSTSRTNPASGHSDVAPFIYPTVAPLHQTMPPASCRTASLPMILAPTAPNVWLAIKARQRCGNSTIAQPQIAGKVQQPVGGRRPERNVVGRRKPDIIPELQQIRADDV